jgi:phosphoglycerol transferase MdoB-like AlkP superfamily enzyme
VHRSSARSNATALVTNPKNINLVLNTPFSFLRTLRIKPMAKLKFFTDEQVEKIYSPIHLPNTEKVFQKKNIVILVLESFGKEGVGFYNKNLDGGTYKGFTPFLDELASKSKVYWQGLANGRKSIDALPSILTSIPSSENPFILTSYSGNNLESLPYLLGKEGYHTSFFHGAPNGSMGFQAFAKGIGVKNYFGKTEYNNDADFDGIWGIWDEPFMHYHAKQLSTFPEPFISTLFSVSSHHPFKVPKQFEGKFPTGPLPILYCMSYTDYALRQFFKEAQKAPWFKNTLFVLTADHATVNYHKEYNNSWGNVAIPILLYAPGDTHMQGVQQNIISQIDIMPTCLGYINYPKPYFAFGQNVLDSACLKMNYSYSYESAHHWYEGKYLLIFDGIKSNGLYNIEIDKAMKNNLLSTESAQAKLLEQHAKAFLQQYNNRLIENKMTTK